MEAIESLNQLSHLSKSNYIGDGDEPMTNLTNGDAGENHITNDKIPSTKQVDAARLEHATSKLKQDCGMNVDFGGAEDLEDNGNTPMVVPAVVDDGDTNGTGDDVAAGAVTVDTNGIADDHDSVGSSNDDNKPVALFPSSDSDEDVPLSVLTASASSDKNEMQNSMDITEGVTNGVDQSTSNDIQQDNRASVEQECSERDIKQDNTESCLPGLKTTTNACSSADESPDVKHTEIKRPPQQKSQEDDAPVYVPTIEAYDDDGSTAPETANHGATAQRDSDAPMIPVTVSGELVDDDDNSNGLIIDEGNDDDEELATVRVCPDEPDTDPMDISSGGHSTPYVSNRNSPASIRSGGGTPRKRKFDEVYDEERDAYNPYKVQLNPCRLCGLLFIFRKNFEAHIKTRPHQEKLAQGAILKDLQGSSANNESELNAYISGFGKHVPIEPVGFFSPKYSGPSLEAIAFPTKLPSKSSKPTPKKPLVYNCDVCTQSFMRSCDLSRHRNKHLRDFGNKLPIQHKKILPKPDETKSLDNSNATDLPSMPNDTNSLSQFNVCKTPNTKSTKGTGLGSGNRRTDTAFACDICGQKFHRSCDLSRHRNNHLLNKTTEEMESMYSHLRYSGTELQFTDKSKKKNVELSEDLLKVIATELSCDICGLKFTRSCDLSRHRNQHTQSINEQMKIQDATTVMEDEDTPDGEDSSGSKTVYKCEFCGKMFNRARNYTVHLRVHTDERPFPCELCGIRFKRLDHRKRHMQTHTKDRPMYPCDHCEMKFGRMEHLKKHMLALHHAETSASIEREIAELNGTMGTDEGEGTNIKAANNS